MHWVLCVHTQKIIEPRNTGEIYHPIYACLESEIPKSPEFSTCSPQQICSKDKEWLFSEYTMDGWSIFSGTEPRGAFITYTFVFGSSTFFALAPVGVYLSHQAIGKKFWKERQMNWWLIINAGVVVSMAALIGGTLFIFVSIFNEF